MLLYHLSMAENGHPLKEEGAQNGTKPKVIVSMPPPLCNMPLHAHQHGRTQVNNVGLQTLNRTMHVCSGGLVKGCGSSNLPDQE
jgi:hypothetical protein